MMKQNLKENKCKEMQIMRESTTELTKKEEAEVVTCNALQ